MFYFIKKFRTNLHCKSLVEMHLYKVKEKLDNDILAEEISIVTQRPLCNPQPINNNYF